MLIPDPCGPEPGQKFVLACFLEQVVNSHNSRSATVHSYTESINTLFQLWKFPISGNLSNKENKCSQTIIGRERREDIAKQCSTLLRKCLLPWPIRPEHQRRTQLNLSCLIGFVLSESLDCELLNMHSQRKLLLTFTNTHPEKQI